MSILDLERVASFVTLGSQVVLVIRLLTLALHRAIPLLTGYLVFDTIYTTIVWILGKNPATPTYRLLWITGSFFIVIFQAALIAELYNLFHKTYPGIRPFTRLTLLIGLGVALLISGGAIAFDLPRLARISPYYQAVARMIFVRRLASSIFAVVAAITTCMIPRTRARKLVALYGSVLSLLFFTYAAEFFIAIMLPLPSFHSNSIVNMIGQFLQLGCYITWIVGFRSEGFRKQLTSQGAQAS